MYLRSLVAIVALTVSLGVSASSAFAGKLVALSIGVSSYASLNDLPSTVNDADAMAKLLAEFGYDARLLRNPNSETIRRAVEEFVDAAGGAEAAVVYFSGHGQQVNGESYFSPADAGPNINAFADHLSVTAILARLQAAGVRTKIVFVDACRNNPYTSRFGGLEAGGERNAGAAERFVLGPGVMISYASAAGETSGDSLLAYSVYTQALLTVLHQSQRVELTQLTRAARRLVRERAAANVEAPQTPFEVSSIDEPVYFVRTPGGRVRMLDRPGSRY